MALSSLDTVGSRCIRNFFPFNFVSDDASFADFLDGFVVESSDQEGSEI